MNLKTQSLFFGWNCYSTYIGEPPLLASFFKVSNAYLNVSCLRQGLELTVVADVITPNSGCVYQCYCMHNYVTHELIIKNNISLLNIVLQANVILFDDDNTSAVLQ